MLTLNDGRTELWQWDTGRTLAVDADCSQVHFSNKVFGRSIDADVIDGVAIIPDILLQTDKDLNVWAFVGTAENGYTKISKTFKVNRRNKPADYVFTPPDQTSLEEIKKEIEYLKSIQDPDAIKNAVENYLEQNPVESPVQSVNGKIGKVELTAEDVGAISQDDLQEATNEALAQAKESGDFDGDDYVLTDDDKTKIAELAAGLVKVPEAPEISMQPLTFAGAVEATYDGSKAVEVVIPQGGGGVAKKWTRIAQIEITEDVNKIYITEDVDGNPFEVENIYAFVKTIKRTDDISVFRIAKILYGGDGNINDNSSVAYGPLIQRNSFGDKTKEFYHYYFESVVVGNYRKQKCVEQIADISNAMTPAAPNAYNDGITIGTIKNNATVDGIMLWAINGFKVGDTIDIWGI